MLVGGVVSLLVSSIFIDCLFRKIVGIEWGGYVRQIPLFGILGAIWLSGCLIYAFRFVDVWDFRKLILFVLCFLLLYVAILKFAKVLNKGDKRLLVSVLRAVRMAR